MGRWRPIACGPVATRCGQGVANVSVADLMDAVREAELRDPQGAVLRVVLRLGAGFDEIARFEHSWRLSLPGDYREFLAYANGCSLFGLDLCSIQGVAVYRESGLLGFHNWSNGDYDCLRMQGGGADVVFMNHGPEVTVPIASSFFDWLTRIVAECRAHGDVLHPGDYRYSERPDGVYAQVLRQLVGVDCELNR